MDGVAVDEDVDPVTDAVDLDELPVAGPPVQADLDDAPLVSREGAVLGRRGPRTEVHLCVRA